MKNREENHFARMYLNGCCLDMGTPLYCDSTMRKGGGKRKRLSGKFSAASFRRLRQFCVTHDCFGECWGVTLTIPSNILNWLWVRDYVHKLSVWCNYQQLPMIWRCELQQRGQAHLHLVCYCSAEKILMLFLEWQRLLMHSGKCLSVEKVGEGVKDIVWVNRMFVNGAHHAFYMEKLTGDFRSWRYLVAHSSKGKLCQQGWLGRQWGIVERKRFVETDAFEVMLDDKRAFYLRRWVRRLTRRKISRHGKHFLLLNPETMRKMVNYLQFDDYFDTPF